MLKDELKALRMIGYNADEKLTLEITLLINFTSSMTCWIVTAKRILNETVKIIMEDCKLKAGNLKVRVCFINYRNIKYQYIFAIKKFTDDFDSVK